MLLLLSDAMQQPSLVIDSALFSNVKNGRRWLTIGKCRRGLGQEPALQVFDRCNPGSECRSEKCLA
jgi:hypothetical protein